MWYGWLVKVFFMDKLTHKLFVLLYKWYNRCFSPVPTLRYHLFITTDRTIRLFARSLVHS